MTMILCAHTDNVSNGDTVHSAQQAETPRPRHRPKIPRAIRAAVYIRDDWRCCYCGRKFKPDADSMSGKNAPHEEDFDPESRRYTNVWLELDHVQPRRFGGTDAIDNLRAACSPCNQGKAASLRASEWSVRIAAAQAILAAGPPNQNTAEKAARALAGVRVTIHSKSRVSIDGA